MTEGSAFIDAVITSAAFCAVLAGSLGYAHRIYRQRYLKLWSIFWALYVLVWLLESFVAGLPAGALLSAGLRTAMIAFSLGARTLLALSIAAYLGWRPPAPRLLTLLASLIAALTAAGAASSALVEAGRWPSWAATPFRTYFLGLFLNGWIALQLLRKQDGRGALSRKLLGVAVIVGAASDGLDVIFNLFVGLPWTSLGRISLVSSFVAHIAQTLLATGMMVAAIGTEYQRAEGAAAALRERDARLHESQRREMLGRLAAGLAHDFNNLLTAVIAHLSLARESVAKDSELWIDIDSAQSAAESGSRLTRQLLTFARRQPLEPKRLDVNELITGLDRMAAPLLGKGILRELRLERGLWSVRADAAQLEQLLLNLIINAREAMPDGGTVRVETANEAIGPGGAARERPALEPGDWIRLSVEDTGLGMDAATQARIFEPFFTTKPSGTGLGLATVQAIVQQAGGQIALRTAPGAGARFTVWLPRLREEPAGEAKQAS